MNPEPSTPTWTAPRLVELSRADQAEVGASYAVAEGGGYGPSAPI